MFDLFHRHHHHHPEGVVWQPKEIHFIMADFTIKDSDPAFTITATFTDAASHTVANAGLSSLTWESSDTAVLVVSPTSDYSASGSPAGTGDATVIMTATLGDGTVITAAGVVTVEAGVATAATLAFTPGA